MLYTPNQTIKALTWKQPFASLMLRGKIETRPRPTQYRGWVLICAAKVDFTLRELDDYCHPEQTKKILSWMQQERVRFYSGNAIAIGRLVDCRPMTKADEERTFVAYRSGLWCHVYEDVCAINPFPYKGRQGWSTPTEEQRFLIRPKLMAA